MIATERIFFSTDWLTLIFLLGLGLVFFMKLYKPRLLLNYFVAFFLRGFIKKRMEEKLNFFSVFHGVLFLFCSLTFSVVITIFSFTEQRFTFSNFGLVFLLFLGYLVLRLFLDIFIENLFNIEVLTRYFRFSKAIYLYTVSLWLLPLLILYQYTFQYKYLLLFLVAILLTTRFVLIINNNKNLIFSNFFYFILYFCTLEIAPLLIFYKITIV